MLNLWNETYTIIFVDMDNKVHQEQLENFELALERYMNVRRESQSFVLKNKSGMVISCDQHHNQPNTRIGSNTYFFIFLIQLKDLNQKTISTVDKTKLRMLLLPPKLQSFITVPRNSIHPDPLRSYMYAYVFISIIIFILVKIVVAFY